MPRSPRLAARAILLHQNRLLLVNAYPGQQSDLWCAPGGGVHAGSSLPDNLAREVYEETGLTIRVGAPALVNEFHDPATGFHQVDIFFRGEILNENMPQAWQDSEGTVNRWRFVTKAEMASLRVKPDRLAEAAWGEAQALYDPLETLVP